MSRAETTLIASPHGGMVPLTGPVDWARHNKGITPSFFTKAEPAVDQDGNPVIDAVGKPSEHVMELCRISIAGDSFSEVVRPVDDEIKERFSDAYRRWKANDQTISGHRLEDWTEAGLSARSIRDMADLNIRASRIWPDWQTSMFLGLSTVAAFAAAHRSGWKRILPGRRRVRLLRKQNQELLSRGGREDCRKIGVSCRCQKEGDRIAAAEGRESDADRRAPQSEPVT